MTRRTARLAALGALAAAAAFASPPAHASSLVYMKDGDVWLAAPDGSHESRLTNDRRHWSPSQADDGTIVAGFGDTAFVRVSRRGVQLGEPVETFLGAPAGDGTFKGPWDAKVSPDGTKVAYSYTWDHTEFDWGCGCYAWSTINATAVSYSSRLTAPSELGELRGWSVPSWIDDAHLLAFTPNATEGIVDSIATHALGGPSGDVLYNANWYTEPGLSTLMDGELSQQGTRLAAMGGLGSDPKTLRLYSVAGAPPYRDGEAGAAVTLACALDIGAPLWASPTWSPDGTQLAWVQEDGIHSATVGDLGRGCAALTSQRLLVPGGSAPDWGPADVPAAVAPPASPGAGAGSPGGSGSTGAGASAATFSPAGAQRLAPALARGLRLRVTARGAVTLRIAATIEPRLARRLGLRGSGAVVASRAVTFTGAGTATVALRFTPRARRALRSLRRVSLKVTLRAQGGAALAARTVTLSR